MYSIVAIRKLSARIKAFYQTKVPEMTRSPAPRIYRYMKAKLSELAESIYKTIFRGYYYDIKQQEIPCHASRFVKSGDIDPKSFSKVDEIIEIDRQGDC